MSYFHFSLEWAVTVDFPFWCVWDKKRKKVEKGKSHTILKWNTMKNSFGLLVLNLAAFVFHGPYSVMISFWKSFQIQSKWKLFCSRKTIQLVSLYCKESGLFFICLLVLPLSFLKKNTKTTKNKQTKSLSVLGSFLLQTLWWYLVARILHTENASGKLPWPL